MDHYSTSEGDKKKVFLHWGRKKEKAQIALADFGDEMVSTWRVVSAFAGGSAAGSLIKRQKQ